MRLDYRKLTVDQAQRFIDNTQRFLAEVQAIMAEAYGPSSTEASSEYRRRYSWASRQLPFESGEWDAEKTLAWVKEKMKSAPGRQLEYRPHRTWTTRRKKLEKN
jgi:hypothetical protein